LLDTALGLRKNRCRVGSSYPRSLPGPRLGCVCRFAAIAMRGDLPCRRRADGSG
jgi:hypothetical protein